MTSTEPSQEARETECDESAPLLPSSGPRYDNISRLLPRWTRMQWRVMLIAAFMMLTANLGVSMGLPPQVKIYEDIICNNYKRALEQDSPHQISLEFDGDICQSPPVQNELALVIGWENTLDVLPSIAIALPYGVLTDRIGRRPFVLSSTIATALTEAWPRVVCWFNWPLRLVWLTGVLRAPGGGDQLAASLIWTIVADVFEEEERATALFRLVSLIIIAELVAVPFGAYTMTIDPWIPYLLGVAIMFVGAVCSIFMPETLNEAKARETDTLSDERTEGTIQPSPLKGSVFDVVIYKAQRFATETRFMWSNSRFLISLAAVFAGTLSRCSQILLIQYASIKYQWSISQASYLISLRSGMSLASFLVFVPLLSFLLLRQLHLSSFTKDLVIARVAAVSGVIGYLLISVAPTPPLLVTGCLVVSLSIPFVIAMVNVTTSFTSPEHVATLHTAMAMCQSIGIIVAGPMFAKLYGSGLQLGVEWSGLPFAVAGSICVLILVSLLFLEVPSDHAL